jgi:hypothetical protein
MNGASAIHTKDKGIFISDSSYKFYKQRMVVCAKRKKQQNKKPVNYYTDVGDKRLKIETVFLMLKYNHGRLKCVKSSRGFMEGTSKN